LVSPFNVFAVSVIDAEEELPAFRRRMLCLCNSIFQKVGFGVFVPLQSHLTITGGDGEILWGGRTPLSKIDTVS